MRLYGLLHTLIHPLCDGCDNSETFTTIITGDSPLMLHILFQPCIGIQNLSGKSQVGEAYLWLYVHTCYSHSFGSAPRQ